VARSLLASAALVFVSSPVLSEVPNDAYVITDKNSSVSRANLVIDHDTFSVDVGAQCALFSTTSNSPDVGSRLEVSSSHPDRLRLKNEKGSLEQTRKDNLPMVKLVTGSGDGQLTNYLLCKQAAVEGDLKTRKNISQGSFEASGKKCACDPSEELEGTDCAAFTAQVNRLVTDCESDKTLQLSFDAGIVNRFKIKGKGDAFPASEVPASGPDPG
jgi:hypothetical protein